MSAPSIRTVPAGVRGRIGLGLVLLLALLGGVGGLLLGRWFVEPRSSGAEEVNPLASTLRELSTPRRLTDFSLTDGAGAPFDRSRLEGQWTLAFFGFTHCPDVCPSTLTRLAETLRRLPPETALQVIFVTVDPARDDIQTVRRYAANFHDDIVGVTGAPAQIGAVARQAGVIYSKPPASGPHAGHYLIDHSTSLALIDPDARLVGQYPELPAVAKLVDSLRAVIARA